jgi:long-subunit fatty acid transport protein
MRLDGSIRLAVLVSFVALILFTPVRNQAALNEDLGISPKAMSLGNAVTADPPGIWAIHFNPAGLASLKGTKAQVNLASAWLSHEVSYSAPDDFGVFGFTDDPVKNRTSKTERAAVLVPLTDQMISSSQGVPAPSSLGLSHSPKNSPFTFATGIYPQLVGGLDRNRESNPARFGGRLAAAERITYFSPSIGYEYSDNLSFGASIGFSYVGISAKSDMRAPNPILGLTRTFEEDICPALSGFGAIGLWIFGAGCQAPGIGPFESAGTINLTVEDTVVPHYNLGGIWEPTEWLGFGLTYRSQATAQLGGSYTIDYSENFEETLDTLNQGPIFSAIFSALQLPRSGSDKQSGQVSLDFTFPEHIKFGTKIDPTTNLQLNVDYGWTNWDRLDSVTADFDRPNDLLRLGRLLTGQGITSITLPRGYQSEDYWGAGLMYDLNQFAQLRLGYEDRESSIPPDKIGMFGPLPDAQLYGAGLGYQWSRNLYLDFSLSHLRAATTVPANTSTNLNSTGVGNIIYNPYAGLDVGFETTATIGSLSVQFDF